MSAEASMNIGQRALTERRSKETGRTRRKPENTGIPSGEGERVSSEAGSGVFITRRGRGEDHNVMHVGLGLQKCMWVLGPLVVDLQVAS